MTEDWEALKDAEDLAYFRAELAEISPGNYPLEEKMRVLEDMREVSSEIENGMREDFARLDEVTQTMFLGRLGASGYRDRDRWRRMLMDGPRQREMPTFWQTKAFLISTEDTALTDEAGTSLRLSKNTTRV